MIELIAFCVLDDTDERDGSERPTETRDEFLAQVLDDK
jgi:hypothetical protein